MATDRRRDERGTGLIALSWGVLAFLLFLFLAVHVAARLYSTSTVSALGHDAARRAALDGGSANAVAAAEQWFRSRVGSGVDVERLEWDVTAEVVRLEVEFDPPDLLIGDVIGGDSVRRAFEVRREVPTAERG